MTASRRFDRSLEHQARLHQLIPGGAHTYARGPDQYPEGLAPVLDRGAGSHVWDVDGNQYIEYGSGLRSVTLGHGYRPVVEAVSAAIARGTSFSRPTALELDAAEDFLRLVPGADMVKFAKNGSDVTTAAVKLARAATGRERVAICRQPFFSVDDWFIGTTPMRAGTLPAAQGLVDFFDYNDAAGLASLIERRDGEIAAVIMEAATALAEPRPGFLESVRSQCDQHGIVLVFDEIITGFRWSEHGAQGEYGVVPDLSCWGKGMGNGFAISALAGKRELMELGGLNTDKERVFLLSTTFGPESVGLAAFRAVVRAYASEDPIGAMDRAGRQLVQGFNDRARALGVESSIYAQGRPACAVFVTCDAAGRPSQEFRTLFLQELLQRGVLGQSLVVSAAHTPTDIGQTLDAIEESLAVYKQALERGGVAGLLRGRPVAPAIRSHAFPRRHQD